MSDDIEALAIETMALLRSNNTQSAHLIVYSALLRAYNAGLRTGMTGKTEDEREGRAGR